MKMSLFKYYTYRLLFVIFLLQGIFTSLLYGQTFTEVPLSITHCGWGDSDWFDYDHDGDLDLITSNPLHLYENNAGTFTSILSGGSYMDLTIFDCNNDNYLDFALAGEPSRLYVYDSGTYIGTELGISVSLGAAESGDLNNDGFDDLLVSGRAGETVELILFINQGDGSFLAHPETIFPGIRQGDIQIADMNNDQLNDVIIGGVDWNGNAISNLYQNEGNLNFQRTQIFEPSKYYTASEIGDIDGQGRIDLAQAGWYTHMVMIQNSSGEYTQTDLTNANIRELDLCMLNFDNDSDLDIIVSGSWNPWKTYFFRNDEGVFVDSLNPDYSAYRACLSAGDYDNDNDVDVFLSGFENSVSVVKILRNETAVINSPPSAPGNLKEVRDGKDLYLTWDRANDDQTPISGLSYNVCIGTTPGGTDIVSPKSSIIDGYRYCTDLGNAGLDTAFMISGLAPGTYYWTVQAIDNCKTGSSFSASKSYEVKPDFELVSIQPLSSSLHIGKIALADYDRDNDMDIVIMGYNHYNDGTWKDSSITYLLKNTDNNFSLEYMNHFRQNGVYEFQFADFNNDNWVDIFASGDTCRLLLNEKSAGFLDPIDLEGGTYTLSVASDINNDGYTDLIYGYNKWKLHTGDVDNISFSSTHNYTPAGHNIVAVMDYNKDARVDFFTRGLLYKNNVGSFELVNEFEYLIEGTLYSSDMDNDNDLDLLYSGWMNEIRYTDVLTNEGNDLFTPISRNYIRKAKGISYPGDFDNDGKTDFFLGGYSSEHISELYMNEGGLEFYKFDFPFVETSDRNKIAFGDIDNDGDLDILILTYNLEIKIYYNNYSFRNEVPQAPVNLSSQNIGYGVKVSWDAATDDHTPSQSLSYNLRIGTTPGGSDIVSPLSGNSGYRYIVAQGNTYLNTFWILDTLEVGSYYWSVQAIDASYKGGEWTAEQTFVITNINADFEADTVCQGLETSFIDQTVTSGSPLTNWEWDFGDGNISADQNPSHIFLGSGAFVVQLVASSGENSDTVTKDIVVLPIPSANFSADMVCQGTSTTFSNTTNANGLAMDTWNWDFGDGSSSTVQFPGAHGYLNSGAYLVELTAISDNGCMDTASHIVNVGAYPTVGITSSGNPEFCVGDSVTLSNTYNPDFSYQWEIGGLDLSGADSSQYVVKNSGDYTVEVTNLIGNCTSTSDPVTINVQASPVSPTITASGSTTFCDVDSVELSVTDNPALSYQWLLNGGAVGQDINSHIVEAGGNYTLVVSNASLCTAASNIVAVTVHASPVIPTVGVNGETAFCEGQSVELSVTNNPALSYQWKDGELNVGGATTNSYTAESTGDYKLSISNGDGCMVETQVVSVIADPAPTAPTIEYTGTLEFCDTDSLVLSVTDNPNYSYEWQLNGGTVGGSSSSYPARATGNYQLKVQNLGDCSVVSANTVSLVVHASPASPTLNLSGPTTFCSDTSVSLSVADPGTDSYQWISGLGEMTNETGASIIIEETGIYKVRVRNIGLCEAFSQEISVTVDDYPMEPVIITDNYEADGCPDNDPVNLSIQSAENGVSYQWSKDGNEIDGATSSTYSGYLVEGSYKVEADNNGCKFISQSQTISYGEMPDKPTILAEGPAIWYLACSNDSATAYKWYLDGLLIEGADEYLYVAGTQEGKFEVAITENTSCFAKSDPLWIPLGTNIDLDPWENLKIYPNPTPGLFTLEMDNHLMGELIIDIFGETGSKIINIKFQKETAHFKTQIDLSGQPPASYLIGLILEDYRVARTLIVE